jgi:hypothetical protein
MAEGLLTPLQLTSGYGLLQNSGIALNGAFSGDVVDYESVGLISDLVATLSLASSANLSNATILSLQTLGNSVCPALGDSIPAASANVAPFPVGSSLGFVGFLAGVGNSYLGNGDVGKFAQAFGAAQGYVSLVNKFIESAVNANVYLGPTFSNLDNMITSDLSKVTLALTAFGQDLQALGVAIDLGNLDHLGEPAALLQQLSAVGNMGNSTLPGVEACMISTGGLTPAELTDLISNNRQSRINPNGLSANRFDRLQQKAYAGLTCVSGASLAEVLAILDVTTANLTTMADLLNPVKILPTSYPSLTFSAPAGPMLIYDTQGDVNSDITSVVNASTPTGCDELGKIIPPPQAAANKALQFQLQQVSGISGLTLPELAAILV